MTSFRQRVRAGKRVWNIPSAVGNVHCQGSSRCSRGKYALHDADGCRVAVRPAASRRRRRTPHRAPRRPLHCSPAFRVSTSRSPRVVTKRSKFFDQGLALIYASVQSGRSGALVQARGRDRPRSHRCRTGASRSAYAQNLGAPRRSCPRQGGFRGREAPPSNSPCHPRQGTRAFAAAVAKRFPRTRVANRTRWLSSIRTRCVSRRALSGMIPMWRRVRLEPDRAHPGGMWTPEGTPAEGTTELMDCTRTRARTRTRPRRCPNPLLHHRGSSRRSRPSAGTQSAKKIESLMPEPGASCIWLQPHLHANRQLRVIPAALVPSRHAAGRRSSVGRRRTCRPPATYASENYTHLLYFPLSAVMMDGRFADAIKGPVGTVDARPRHALPASKPALEPLAAQQMLVPIRLARRKGRAGAADTPESATLLAAMHHFGRGASCPAMPRQHRRRDEGTRRVPCRARQSPAARFQWQLASKVPAVAVTQCSMPGCGRRRAMRFATVAAWKKAAAEDELRFSGAARLVLSGARIARYQLTRAAARKPTSRSGRSERNPEQRTLIVGTLAGTARTGRRRDRHAGRPLSLAGRPGNDADITLRLDDS